MREHRLIWWNRPRELEPPPHGLAAWLGSLAGTARLVVARPTVQDSLMAAALSAAALAALLTQLDVSVLEGEAETFRRLDMLGVGLVLLQTAPLSLRRRAPVWILGITATALLVFSFRDYPPSLASFGFMLALYTVAAYRGRRVSMTAAIGSAITVLAILLLGRKPVAPDSLMADYLIVGAAWFLGEGVRLKRGHVERLQDRATRLEREREERAREAVAQERRVIARELHDVVAHNVSVIVAQAGAAQRIFDAQPEEARSALGLVERTGREALVEMRRLTGFLRMEDDHTETRYPQPGLHGLDGLLTQVREAGVPVALRIEGSPRPLPAGLELSAFRIVQEALTNTLKHAGPARAEVVVRYGEACLDLIITDDGIDSLGQVNGDQPWAYGQLGMRERVALFGGELRVGRAAGGQGYTVHASLPLDGSSP